VGSKDVGAFAGTFGLVDADKIKGASMTTGAALGTIGALVSRTAAGERDPGGGVGEAPQMTGKTCSVEAHTSTNDFS
jgi:hypothetical protein